MLPKRRIRNTADIVTLPGYVSRVDPKVTPLKRIVDSYNIAPASIACSLCGHEHKDGRIVELENGGLTNIGHICGRRFGEQRYVDAMREYLESLDGPQLRAQLAEGRHKLESLQVRLSSLRDDCVYIRMLTENFRSRFSSTFQDILRRALANRPDIYESIELTEAEIDEAAAAQPHVKRETLRYREVKLGTIVGYRSASTDWSSNQGVMRLFAEVLEFERFRSSDLSKIRRWVNWLSDLEENMNVIKRSVEDSLRFFSVQNFTLFAQLPGTQEIRHRLSQLTVRELALNQPMHQLPESKPSRRLGVQRASKEKPTVTAKELRRMTGDKKMRLFN